MALKVFIEGNIGAGKSSLMKELKKKHYWPNYKNNPIDWIQFTFKWFFLHFIKTLIDMFFELNGTIIIKPYHSTKYLIKTEPVSEWPSLVN